MGIDTAHWQGRLDDLAGRYLVPGASLAILADGEVATVATGVVNLGTGVETTPDSVFQVGSITKVWTATLIMQLVDEGRLDLDAPLTDVLPELTLATPGATSQVTVRHLLSHSSGIDGDLFDDAGRGADSVERYVAICAKLTQLHPAGATMSYSNSGFVIAGRIIERLTGGTWDAALKSRLIRPLGLTRTVTLPEEAIRFRAAYGHQEVDGTWQLAPVWALPGGSGPAGGIVATAADIVAFTRLHLSGGTVPDGTVPDGTVPDGTVPDGRVPDSTRLLSAASTAEMQRPQIVVPSYQPGSRHVGLGWHLYDWDGHRMIAHNGGTIGQYAFLVALPESNGAVCLLTNGGRASLLYQDLFTEIFGSLWQIPVPPPPEPAAEPMPVEASRYVGHFEREGIRIEVTATEDGSLAATAIDTGPLADVSADPVETYVLRPLAPDVFVGRAKEDLPWATFIFYEVDGHGRYLHCGGRATPRRD
jgi:CubicO group peptidase (beta-lactamase class C family)